MAGGNEPIDGARVGGNFAGQFSSHAAGTSFCRRGSRIIPALNLVGRDSGYNGVAGCCANFGGARLLTSRLAGGARPTKSQIDTLPAAAARLYAVEPPASNQFAVSGIFPPVVSTFPPSR